MIVISDTSPINNLAVIDQLNLLQQLYGIVIIPEAVYQELTQPKIPVAGAVEVQSLDWIQVRQVTNQALAEGLKAEIDAGEAEAIALALELNEQLLIDEKSGRIVATRLKIKFTGFLGILIEAKNQNLISAVKPLLDDLIEKAGFWVARPLYENILQMANE